MSYIYGANSNMQMDTADGEKAGVPHVISKASANVNVGNWGVQAPFDGTASSDIGGPDGAKNAAATYLYRYIEKGLGYIGRGRPAESTDYDDASSLQTTRPMAVVF